MKTMFLIIIHLYITNSIVIVNAIHTGGTPFPLCFFIYYIVFGV